jgi:hypothetical protein
MSEQPPDVAEQIGTDPSVDETNDASGKESYHGYSVDDETQPQSSGDSLVDDRGLANPLDEGYSPPEKYSAGQGWGNTPLEEEMRETIDQRLEQEVPEVDPYEQAETMSIDELEGIGEPAREVGEQRAGRIVEPGRGVNPEVEGDLIGDDVGIAGAASSAEEAAVHIVDPSP